MKSFYPTDEYGNKITFYTAESYVYDKNGRRLTDKLSEIKNTLDKTASKEALNVEKSRIDTLTKLQEGSTSGDAELSDIRVKHDGTTSSSAGNAVREQYNDLSNRIVTSNNLIFNTTNYDVSILNKGSLEGELFLAYNKCFKAISFIEFYAEENTSGSILFATKNKDEYQNIYSIDVTLKEGVNKIDINKRFDNYVYLFFAIPHIIYDFIETDYSFKMEKLDFTEDLLLNPFKTQLLDNLTVSYGIKIEFLNDNGQINIENNIDSIGNELNNINDKIIKSNEKIQNLDNIIFFDNIEKIDIAPSLINNQLYTTNNNGSWESYNGWYSSDYRDISELKVFKEIKLYTTIYKYIYCISFWDEHKVFINGITGNINNMELNETIVQEIPINSKYYRITSYKDSKIIPYIEGLKSTDHIGIINQEVSEIENRISEIENNVFTKPKQIIYVAKDGTKDFITINDALNYAYTIESEQNPITIIIYPGIYDEICKIGSNHYISLIGMNRNTCIIKNTNGEYSTCPLRISGNAYISNLSLISNHDSNNTLVIDGVVQKNLSYGLHIDDRHFDDDKEYRCTVENCYIYSEQNPAVGIGLDKNLIVELINCECISNISEDIRQATTKLDTVWGWKPDGGAIFFHALYSGSYTNDEGYQKLIIKNCIIRNNTSNVIYGEPGGMTEKVTLEFINNVGCSEQNGLTIFQGLKNATISPLSYGNNCLQMNYIN